MRSELRPRSHFRLRRIVGDLFKKFHVGLASSSISETCATARAMPLPAKIARETLRMFGLWGTTTGVLGTCGILGLIVFGHHKKINLADDCHDFERTNWGY